MIKFRNEATDRSSLKILTKFEGVTINTKGNKINFFASSGGEMYLYEKVVEEQLQPLNIFVTKEAFNIMIYGNIVIEELDDGGIKVTNSTDDVTCKCKNQIALQIPDFTGQSLIIPKIGEFKKLSSTVQALYVCSDGVTFGGDNYFWVYKETETKPLEDFALSTSNLFKLLDFKEHFISEEYIIGKSDNFTMACNILRHADHKFINFIKQQKPFRKLYLNVSNFATLYTITGKAFKTLTMDGKTLKVSNDIQSIETPLNILKEVKDGKLSESSNNKVITLDLDLFKAAVNGLADAAFVLEFYESFVKITDGVLNMMLRRG